MKLTNLAAAAAAATLLALPSPGAAGEKSAPSPSRKNPPRLYVVALEDQGRRGEEIGCGDSLVSLPADPLSTASEPIRSVLEQLLALDSPTSGGEELYNALGPSDLKVESAKLEKGKATVRLRGQLQLGGTCDNPRVEAQLGAVVRQFPGVRQVTIFVNGEPLEKLLSSK